MCKTLQRSKMWLMRVKQKNYEIDHKRTTSKYESLEPNLNKKKPSH